jgi:hypothetical protein
MPGDLSNVRNAGAANVFAEFPTIRSPAVPAAFGEQR